MYVYMYVYMYVCMYIFMCVCMYVYMYTYMYSEVQPQSFVYVHYTYNYVGVTRVRMTLDETGIYMHVELFNGTDRLFYFYYNGVLEQIGELTLSGFATTSPGTQPLPKRM